MNKSKVFNQAIFIYFVIICKIWYVSTYQIFDIRILDNDMVSGIMEETEGSLTMRSYIINDQSEIIRVTDGPNIIWTSYSYSEVLSLFKLYQYYKVDKLCYVHTRYNDIRLTRHYFKEEGVWIQIHEYQFKEYLEYYDTHRKLDLKNLFDDGTCFVDTHRFGGIPATIYIPKEKYHLIAVMNGPDPIWIREADFDRCTSVILHGSPDEPKLININLKLSGNFEQKFYNFEDGSWKEITKTHFYQTLEVLDNEANEGENQQTEQTE